MGLHDVPPPGQHAAMATGEPPPIVYTNDWHDPATDTVFRVVLVPAGRLRMLPWNRVEAGTVTWSDLVVHGGMRTSYTTAPFVFSRWGLPGDGKRVMLMEAPLADLDKARLRVAHSFGAPHTPATKQTTPSTKAPRPPVRRNLLAEL